MEFVYNDLSLHGQFASIAEGTAALRALLGLRTCITRAGLILRYSRYLLDRPIGPSTKLRDIIYKCPEESLRRAAFTWLDRGPFWDDERRHSADDYFEFEGEVVTDTGLAEAAFAVSHGDDREMVSSVPSAWQRSPLRVEWVRSDTNREARDLANHWDAGALERRCSELERPVANWPELVERAERDFPRLTFSPGVGEPLMRQPFSPGAAREIHSRLRVLNELKGRFTPEGGLDSEGLRLHQAHFVGEKAWFSDSSDDEKSMFRGALTFRHPRDGSQFFCPWHGKVKIEQIRIHFSHPITRDGPLYVLYIGPKLTKR